MVKVLLIAGHGYNDSGAVGNGTTERDFIRQHIVDRVQKYVKQAGVSCDVYNKSQDMYQDTAYGQRLGNYRDYGMYWAKNQGYNVFVEFHLDAAGATAQGGHVIIASGLNADSIDTGIANVLDKYVDLRGGKGIDKRNDLLHVNLAKQLGINYRLVELGFITNAGDMKEIRSDIEDFCREIAEAIVGKKITVKLPSKTVKKKKTAVKKRSTSTAYYTVKKGDTLYGIARKYGISLNDLLKLNTLTATSLIKNGDKVKVPAVKKSVKK